MDKLIPGPYLLRKNLSHGMHILASHQGSAQVLAQQIIDETHGQLLAAAPELLAACKDMELLAKGYERNREILEDALRKAGMPSNWLVGWDPKIQRLREAIAKTEGK